MPFLFPFPNEGRGEKALIPLKKEDCGEERCALLMIEEGDGREESPDLSLCIDEKFD